MALGEALCVWHYKQVQEVVQELIKGSHSASYSNTDGGTSGLLSICKTTTT